MKTMQGFSLGQYMERRRRAAAVAHQRVNDPRFVVGSWVERKLQFDRQFSILMRANYFWRNTPIYAGQNVMQRIAKWVLVIVVLSIVISVAVTVVRSTLVAKQATQDAARMERALVHCLNGGALDVGDGVQVICVAAR